MPQEMAKNRKKKSIFLIGEAQIETISEERNFKKKITPLYRSRKGCCKMVKIHFEIPSFMNFPSSFKHFKSIIL